MDYEMIKYTRIHRLNNRFGRGSILVKVKYEVSHISRIELLQNPMEKLLGLGHLRFVGYTYHEAKKHMDRIEPVVVHCLYGVVMKKHPEKVSVLQVENPYELMDADTPETLQMLLQHCK